MAFKSFKGGKPKAGGGAGKVGKPGRKAGRPKGGVFKHKKGGKKGQKQGAAAVPGGAVAAATPKFKPKPVVASAAGASGDADDFEMDLPDYRPPAGENDSGSDHDQSDGEGQQQQLGAAAAEAKAAKRRRKRGPKLSAMEFEAKRQMAQQVAECSAEEQADWLWSSYQQHSQASALERGGLSAEGMAPLPAEGSLEDRLRALQPASWQQDFCGQQQYGGKAAQQWQGAQQQHGQRPPGSPSLLLVSPSAIGAVNIIKLCPQFNRACKVGKLFAKHFKVAEQEEALRTQVMCLAAGTPNRLCKLADGGALRLDRLKHVVVDVQLDAKQRDILAIPETRADWWQFYERHLKGRLAAGGIKLSLVNSDRLGPGN